MGVKVSTGMRGYSIPKGSGVSATPGLGGGKITGVDKKIN
jgi:hypothetical protein